MARTLRSRRPAARRSRLTVEAFDDRLLPSATVGLADGVLSITADKTHRANFVVAPIPTALGQPARIVVADQVARTSTTWNAADVKRIDFAGGPLNDRFENRTFIPSHATGGAGNDTLIGGQGDDVFVGSPGRDVYTGVGGRDLIFRNGYRAVFSDPSDKNAVVGVNAGRLTPGDLKVEGDLDVYLNGNRLWFSGPTGAGFALRADWQAAADSGTIKYTATGPVTLESAWGDITLPTDGGTLGIGATATVVPGVGVFDTITWGGRDVTFSSPTGQYATQLESLTGATVSLPGMSWGLALGKDIDDPSAPLNPAVPYLYATASTGYSFGYDHVSVSPDGSYRGTFAFAPGDGTVYAGITGLPVLGDFGLGVSTNGYLPYAPDQVPDGLSPPTIYGHYYVRGQISLDDAGLPVAVSGNLVLDLDANDNGTLVGGALSKDRIDSALETFWQRIRQPERLLAGVTRTVFADTAVGFNGGLQLQFHGLNLDLSESSFWMTPTTLAFRAATTNPFDGIPYLQDIPNDAGIDIQGFARRSGVWHAHLYSAAGVPGVTSGLVADAGSDVRAVRVTVFAHGTLPMIGSFDMELGGTVYFNGDYNLGGSTHISVGDIDGTLYLSLSSTNGRPSMSWGVRPTS